MQAHDSFAEVVALKTQAAAPTTITPLEYLNLYAETAAYLSAEHPAYGALASEALVEYLHATTPGSIMAVAQTCADQLSSAYKVFVEVNGAALQRAIDYQDDMSYDYFGLRTLMSGYLLKDSKGTIVERPQDMLMRVAIWIGMPEYESIVPIYKSMSEGRYTHASPTLFHAGTRLGQAASCFLLPVKSDSIDGIYETLTDCAQISKSGGGVAISVSNVRSAGARISSTGGESQGIVPMLKLFDQSVAYIDQGGRRKGAMAVYLEPHHPDIFDFLELKKNVGIEERRARNLFYGLWVSDLFMRRVKNDEKWSLFCPYDARLLVDKYGREYEAMYEALELSGKAKRVVKARDLWSAIVTSQIETGGPYMLYKDAANAKSNQRHLGTIRSSNLCAEIIEFSSSEETAVCNLASIALPKHVVNGHLDKVLLADTTRRVVFNLNAIIDKTTYPTANAYWSNNKHRPIGVGVQGLADVFAMLNLPFDSPEAAKLNEEIFRAIYCAALSASAELAHLDGIYTTYCGSPAFNGLYQPELWGKETPAELKEKIKHTGLRNSLLIALMPTASTAQILGNNESIEPFTANIYTRRTQAGEFIIVNKHLVAALLKLGLWNSEMKNKIIAGGGSVQHIAEIPQHIKDVFKTVWEIKQRVLIDLAVGRAPYVCQSQSLNIFMAKPTMESVSSMHFYGWEKGLKTGMYYLRTKPAAMPNPITVVKECTEACSA